MKAKEDYELRAIREIMRSLKVLDEQAQFRVIGYIRSRLFSARDDIFQVCDDLEKESGFDKEDSCEG